MNLQIQVIDNTADIAAGFRCARDTFGHQVHDGIWTAFNPGWDTEEGEAKCAERLSARFRATTSDKSGQPNTVFLKATVADASQPAARKLVGFAIWQQVSAVDGYGDKPVEDMSKTTNMEELYPGQPDEQAYLVALDRSLHGQRVQLAKAKAAASPPAIFVLDLCCVFPEYQGNGIAQKLVLWGLDEAKKRNNTEAVTEASSMGRHAYAKLGFVQEGDEITYDVPEKFKHRQLPSNIFMRTRPEKA